MDDSDRKNDDPGSRCGHGLSGAGSFIRHDHRQRAGGLESDALKNTETSTWFAFNVSIGLPDLFPFSGGGAETMLPNEASDRQSLAARCWAERSVERGTAYNLCLTEVVRGVRNITNCV